VAAFQQAFILTECDFFSDKVGELNFALSKGIPELASGDPALRSG